MRISLIVASVLASSLGAGCATEGGPRPTEEMTRARTLIEQADRANAQHYAAADLQRAHDELDNADRASAERKYGEARRYAEAAAVDADVAQARASEGDAERAAQEIDKSSQTLRQESERHGAMDRGAVAPEPPPSPETGPASPDDTGPPPDTTEPNASVPNRDPPRLD